MAAEDSVRQLDHFRTWGFASVPVMAGRNAGYEAAGETYLAGSPLKRSSGQLTEISNADNADIVGFACFDATGVTNARVDYTPAVPGILFEATLEDQANGDHALAVANLYVPYAFRVTAGGLWYLNENDTDNDVAVIVALIDDVGTAQGRVLAQLLIDAVSIYCA
jgi:hypothetical protein